MTNEEKLKANMAAARLIGYASPHHDGESVFVHATDAEKDDSGLCLFDIFSNPADCLSVVKMLGETAALYPFHDYGGWHIVNEYGEAQLKNSGHPRTYEEAVAAAVLEVSK